MPKLILLLLSLLFAQLGFSQAKIAQFQAETINGVTISSSEKVCKILEEGIDYQHIVLEIDNKNDFEVIVEWDEQLQYNSGCFNCNPEKLNPELHKQVVIPANSTISGKCQYPKDTQLTIFKSFNQIESDSELLQFNLDNISVIQQSNY